MTILQDLSNCFKAEALRNGIWLTDQDLERILSFVMDNDKDLPTFDFQLKAIMQDLAIFARHPPGPYRLFHKMGNTWSIRNEHNKEILVGSKERMIKAIEAHLAEMANRRQAAASESWVEFDNIIIPCSGKDARI